MGMKLTFLCCVAGELKDNIVGTTKNSRLFFYRAYEDQTITDMMEDGFFDGAQELRVDDLILLYDPNTKNEYEMVRIESTQGTVKTKKVDLLDVHKIYEILDEHQQEIDNNAALIAELDADVVHKSTATDIVYGRKSNNEFDYTPKNDFDGVGSSEHIPTTAGIAKSFNTPLSPTNKGASMSEIGVLGNQIDALDAKIDIAGTSGKIIGSYWFGKTKASTVVPAPTLVGQNYYDFTTGQVYKSTDGTTWTLDGTNTPPTDIDAQIIISSKFWDITEQENQHGGKAWWSHTNSEWSYSPTIYEDKPAGGASLPLLTPIFADHQLNDASYLNANTFSWQAGSVYEAVYQHLVDDFNNKITTEWRRWAFVEDGTDKAYVYTQSMSPKIGDPVISDETQEFIGIITEITLPNLSITVSNGQTYSDAMIFSGKPFIDAVNGIVVLYYKTPDGHHICLPDQESAISQLYEKTGEANFYILDTTNARFKLPRTQKRRLIRAVKNADSTWYNLYSDGWVEQGGQTTIPSTDRTVTFLVEMQDTNYAYQASGSNSTYGVGIMSLTTTSMKLDYTGSATGNASWQVSGYAANSVIANEPVQYEYYYVGNFTKGATENTAGLNAELFNNKADLNLMNTASNVDFVVDWQRPTAENNYTWYRKYKSGWVEQGGRVTVSGTISETNVRITFPVEMANTQYTAICANNANVGVAGYVGWESTTAMSVGTMSSKSGVTSWYVCGFAA